MKTRTLAALLILVAWFMPVTQPAQAEPDWVFFEDFKVHDLSDYENQNVVLISANGLVEVSFHCDDAMWTWFVICSIMDLPIDVNDRTANNGGTRELENGVDYSAPHPQ